MSAQSAPKSFDDIIQADRKKRKAAALAQQIFGKGRPANGVPDRKNTPSPGASLASRMGVTKRSASSTSVDRPARSSRPNSVLARYANASRLEEEVNRNGPTAAPALPAKSKSAARPGTTRGDISIRGAAGPYVVVAQNFAPGTTAADIESVMQPIGGDLISCRLTASTPTVIAEMTFLEKQGAENVIATFNNKKADGRLLYVFMKSGTSGSPEVVEIARPEHFPSKPSFVAPVEPVAPVSPVPAVDTNMEVDQEPASDPYRGNQPRRQEEQRRDDRYGAHYEDRRPNPAYQDGRYGYGPGAGGPRYDNRRNEQWRGDGRMYSDNLHNRRQGPRGGW